MAFTYLKPEERWTARPCAFTWRGVKSQPLIYAKRLNLYTWRGVPLSHIRVGLMILHLNPRRAHRLLAATRRQLRAVA